MDTILNIGLSELVEEEGSNFTASSYYAPHELLPHLKKPPADRDAPGEFGHPFEIPRKLGPSVERQVNEGYRRFAFNVLASDIISVHRNLGDKREDECKVGHVIPHRLFVFFVKIFFNHRQLFTRSRCRQ